MIHEAELAAAAEPTPGDAVEEVEHLIGVGEQAVKGAVRERRGQARPPARRAASRGRMDDPGNDLFDERDPLERLLSIVGAKLDELRSLFDDASSRWRGDAMRLGEGTRQRANSLFYELGLITREDWDELDLRVAQLEHRLRLIEERLDERTGRRPGEARRLRPCRLTRLLP